ncbi:hypothetical protein H4R34_006303, partial [Dimargaris verticillata]
TLQRFSSALKLLGVDLDHGDTGTRRGLYEKSTQHYLHDVAAFLTIPYIIAQYLAKGDHNAAAGFIDRMPANCYLTDFLTSSPETGFDYDMLAVYAALYL